jgi:hypothetical protein
MELTPKAIQNMLDELQASRASRKRAWENLQEIRLGTKGFRRYGVAATGKEDN